MREKELRGVTIGGMYLWIAKEVNVYDVSYDISKGGVATLQRTYWLYTSRTDLFLECANLTTVLSYGMEVPGLEYIQGSWFYDHITPATFERDTLGGKIAKHIEGK